MGHCNLERNERNLKMTPRRKPLRERQAWNALEAHYKNIREQHLRKLSLRTTPSAASS